MMGIIAFDARDMIFMLEAIFGRTEEDTARGIYTPFRRYSLCEFGFSYEDGTPVTDIIKPENIIDHSGNVIVTADDINRGLISSTPLVSISAAKVAVDILYALMYANDSPDNRRLYYYDPLGLSDIPLIPIEFVSENFSTCVEYILSHKYNATPSQIDDMLSFLSSEMTTGNLAGFGNERVYDINSDGEYFLLTDKGSAREFRYDLGLIKQRILL